MTRWGDWSWGAGGHLLPGGFGTWGFPHALITSFFCWEEGRRVRQGPLSRVGPG